MIARALLVLWAVSASLFGLYQWQDTRTMGGFVERYHQEAAEWALRYDACRLAEGG